jgi:hypothetical protein
MTTFLKQKRDLEFPSDPWTTPVSNLDNNLINDFVKLTIETDRLLPVTKERKILQLNNSRLG